jgi:hypothetical protein
MAAMLAMWFGLLREMKKDEGFLQGDDIEGGS